MGYFSPSSRAPLSLPRWYSDYKHPRKKKNPWTPSLDKSRRLRSGKAGIRMPNPVLISLHCYIVAGSNMMKIKRRWEGEAGGRQEGIKGRREGKEATYDKYFMSPYTHPGLRPLYIWSHFILTGLLKVIIFIPIQWIRILILGGYVISPKVISPKSLSK